MRACGITDDRLFGFVDGLEETLDEHIATCDDCQAFLAELWIGEAPHDLSVPVMRQIRFEEFLVQAARLGLDVLSAMGRALVELGSGADSSPGPDGSDEEREDP